MRRQVYVHDGPDRCVIGTVGEPGQRVFFLQARSGRRINTVVLEKVQVQALAERMVALLEEMVERGQVGPDETRLADPLDDRPLDTPIEEDFRVGAVGFAWNQALHRLVLEAHEAETEPTGGNGTPELEDDTGPGPVTLRIRLTFPAAREFARRALEVVAAGRPQCPFCQQSLDPGGHICPRSNGYRR